LFWLCASPFKSKSRLEVENAVLWHQLIVLRRRVRGRAQPTNNDRWFLVWIDRWFPFQAETPVRWHRAGFAAIGVGNRGGGEGAREKR